MGLLVVSLPGLAALVALLFTWMSVGQTRTELRIAEQGQITNRFNAAVEHLGSPSVDVRLGGLYALQRIMRDSSRDQPAIVSILCGYVRQHALIPANGFDKINEDDLFWGRSRIPSDIQAVLNVLSERSPDRDGGYALDLSNTELRLASLGGPFRHAILTDTDLRGASLSGADLRDADFSKSNLAQAWLDGARLTDAWFQETNLKGAKLFGAKLTGADFQDADLREAEVSSPDQVTDLTNASFFSADLRGAGLEGAKLTNAVLVDADLSGAFLAGASLRGARLSTADKRLENEVGAELEPDANASLRKADLTRADLRGADLREVDLRGANLLQADLRGAKLSGAKLTGATLTGVRGLPHSPNS
ncbi:pentapeptide repeat-containing protein [Streptomyces canus]|uniref:pentapeptide repeat-containing protein n=1 Tax=Streptomyces canus TaxID=58343 RepID=UPI00324E6DBA